MRVAKVVRPLALTFLAALAGACGGGSTGSTGTTSTAGTTGTGGAGTTTTTGTTSAGGAGGTSTTTTGNGGNGGHGGATSGTGGSASGGGGASSGTGGAGGMGGTSAGTGGGATSAGGMGGMPGGTGGMGGMGSSSSSSSSSGNPGDICSVACQAQHDFGCVTSTFDCIVTCQAVQASNHACAAELQTYYACYADHVADLSVCSMPDACVPAFGNVLFCAENYCSTAACDHQESICTCPGICNNHAVLSVCDGADCTCFLNGAVVGTCTDSSIPICGLKESCCTVLYFLN